MCRDHLVVETVTALHHEALPAIRLFADRELDDDPTNFCAPNPAALELMLRNSGFNRVEIVPSPVSYGHRGAKNWLKRSDSKTICRTIAHGWRS